MSLISCDTGYTATILKSTFVPNILTISGKNSDPVFEIKSAGEIYYNSNGKMVKVNCPDDIAEAFLCSVLNYTGQQPEDFLIDTYINKILNNERSDEYINKLEKKFRKLKIDKIKNK